MSLVKEILLIGGGGHCRSCIDVIESQGKYRIMGIVGRKDSPSGNLFGYPVLGYDEDLVELRKRFDTALVTVGQIKNPQPRILLYQRLKEIDFKIPVVVSPKACVSKHSNLEEGSIVLHGALVNAGAEVGTNCIINSQALVEHDVIIEDHCHVSTGVKLNGDVVIGTRTFIGSGTIIREGVLIGANSVISAGSVILKDLPKGTFNKGNL